MSHPVSTCILMAPGAAFRKTASLAACFALLLTACGDEVERANADAGNIGKDAGSAASTQSQAKDYDSCEAIHRDAQAVFDSRHQLQEPRKPEFPSRSIHCDWSFSDDERCRAIDFVPGSGSGDCVSDRLTVSIARHVGGLENVAKVVADYEQPTNNFRPYQQIQDPRLKPEKYRNIVVLKRRDNENLEWVFKMVITGDSANDPAPTTVSIQRTLYLPSSSDLVADKARPVSPPPPSDRAIVSVFLNMLEDFEDPYNSWFQR